jgi:hypothetical protein
MASLSFADCPARAMLLAWIVLLIVASPSRTQQPATSPEDAPANRSSPGNLEKERLQELVDRAREGLARVKAEVQDYEFVLTKQERVGGRLLEPQDIAVKIRHEKREGDTVVTPFSVYAKFISPAKIKGREVIYVEGQRGGDLLARRGGRRNPNMTVQLVPDGPLAMDGHRYPITQIGFVIMLERLIEVMETKFVTEDCEIRIYQDAKLDGRPCQHFELTMREKKPESGFMRARVFVDNEYRVPVFYAAYDWPKEEGGKPVLLEMYAYRRVKLNVGLTDKDFDPTNPDYNFAEVKPLPDDVGDD